MFIIVTSCKQPKCPSAGELINDLCYTHMVGYNSATDKNKVLIDAQQPYLKNCAEEKDKKQLLTVWFLLYTLLEQSELAFSNRKQIT